MLGVQGRRPLQILLGFEGFRAIKGRKEGPVKRTLGLLWGLCRGYCVDVEVVPQDGSFPNPAVLCGNAAKL